MADPILKCVICGRLVPLEEAHADAEGNPIHSECEAKSLADVAISPMSLSCPRWHAQPGAVCIVLADRIEGIHIERINWAVQMDIAGGGN
jgi:hypothetical protein